MKQLVILGAGTGGTLIANLLSQQLDLSKWQITVIDKAQQHVYQPGLLFIPFALYGYDDAQNLVQPIHEPLPRNVRFIAATIKLIDHHLKRVETTQGLYPYDILICALGCRLAPEEIDGLNDSLGQQVFTFYSLEHAVKLRAALDRIQSGRVVVHICDMPIKCPVAPIEFIFLADYYFQLKGIRNQIELTFVTPLSGSFTKPNANLVLTSVAKDKHINIVSNFNVAEIHSDKKYLRSFEGEQIEYDLLVTIPPNLGAEAIELSGLGDGSGYAVTNPRTLKSKLADYIYCIGDNTNVNTSKAGSATHFEAETVVNNILREIDDKPPLANYDGHANCFIESGYHKALLLDFNYDLEPLPGNFPVPHLGPFSLLQETYLNHVGKMTFDWIYWNMLLPGRLGYVPLLPSHMSIMGKDLAAAPQIKRAKTLHVQDVMTKDVVTIQQGLSITEAAAVMNLKRVSGLPVLDPEQNLVGIITEADFISALDLNNASISGQLEAIVRKYRSRKQMGTVVDDLMTKKVVTIKPNDTLQVAITLMEQNRIKRLVVTSYNNKVQGIISRADVMKLFAIH